jgi:hypothetical protein
MMGSSAMTEVILQAVTIVVWVLSALLALMGLRELVRLHLSSGGKVTRQATSLAKKPIPLVHKRPVKLSPGIGHSHSDQQISKIVERCPHREVKFEKRRRQTSAVSTPIRGVHNVQAVPWLAKRYEESYITQ